MYVYKHTSTYLTNSPWIDHNIYTIFASMSVTLEPSFYLLNTYTQENNDNLEVLSFSN